MSAPLRRLERPEPDWPEIPGYALESVIGRGSTGTVYRAVQVAVEREVAIKVLHPELVAKPRVVERLRREARTMARLHHPHLISAIDMGERDGRWWFAMEFVDGPSLADRIRSEGPLTEREALRLFLPLAEALEALWEGGVVHRDIKPANVLLERGPRGGIVRARLADLGLAFSGDEPGLTGQGGTLGTPHYISPEQARDPSGVDTRSDIWSFGATLFHALCGRPPFTGESMAEVLSSVLHGRIPDPQRLAPHLGRGMALVVRRCLVRDPAGRYQDPPELLGDLELLRERRAPAVRPAQLDPLDHEGPPWRRLAVGAAGLVVVGAGLAMALGRLGGADVPGATAGETVRAPLLERLVEQVENRPSRLAGAWLELEGLRDAAPDDLVWLEVRADLLAQLDRTVGELLAERTLAVRAAVDRSDFAGARGLVTEAGLGEALRRATGFDLAELPAEAARRIESWRRERGAEVEGALRRTVDAFADGVSRYREELLLPELERLRGQGRWRSAFALTELSGEELAGRAGLDPDRLPPEELEAATVQTRVRLDLERVELERAWRSERRSLVAWVEAEVDTRLTQAALAPLGRPVALDLRARWQLELTRRGLESGEFPEDAAAELEQALVDAERRFEEASRLATARRMREAFDLRAEVLTPALLAGRRYGAAVELWEAFLERLASTPDAAPELLAAARQERDGARRLEAVLRRAADGVRAARGSELELRVGNIRVPGRIDAGVDPLADGFLLRPANGDPYRLDLRRLSSADLERLAGLDGPTGQLEPDDRLALALLAAAEGDLARAQRVAGSGPLPADSPAGPLDRLGAAAAERVAGAALLARLDAAGPAGDAGGARLAAVDPTAAAALIGVLLEDHLDEPTVALRSNQLRRELEQLERARAGDEQRLEALVAAHPGAEVRPAGPRRARIVHAAGTAGPGAPLVVQLRAPLEPLTGPWTAELELAPVGPERPTEVALTVAGYRVVWRERAGAGPDAGEWWGGTADEVPFARGVPGASGTRGPVDGAVRRTLRLEWDRPRASLALFVDGARVLSLERAPVAAGVAPRLELEADAPLAVERLELEGPLR